ncbi:MAG: glycerophosphodiester phosphodiesterase family protein [Protaetiibacter sp.]
MTAVPPRIAGGALPRISGHRGAAGTAPENTIRSFRAAISDGAGTVELDLQRSADHALIVMHDSTVDRTTGGTGRVNDLELSRIRELRAGGEPVPTFTEVLDAIDAPIQVEVKDPLAVEPLIALLRERPEIGARVVLSGFSEEVLRELAAAVPEVPRGLICRGYDDTLLGRLADLGCEVVYSGWPGLTADAVRALHDAGLSVAAWNVNTREELARALALGVDEISTDHPALVAGWLESGAV